MPLGQGAAAAGATHRSGGGNGSGSATITIDASSPGAAVSTDVLGANMAVWYDITQSGLSKEFTQAGMREVRWPGGSASDEYHWQTQAFCNGGYGNSNSSFDNFMQDVVKPAKLDVSITLNYGSNSACNAGGDPNEAAAWVKYANTTSTTASSTGPSGTRSTARGSTTCTARRTTPPLMPTRSRPASNRDQGLRRPNPLGPARLESRVGPDRHQ